MTGLNFKWVGLCALGLLLGCWSAVGAQPWEVKLPPIGTPSEIAVCLEPVEPPLDATRLIGRWKNVSLAERWHFTKDGQLIATALDSKGSLNLYKVEGNKLAVTAAEKSGPDASAFFTITRLTDTSLILVTQDGRKIELQRVK